MTVNPTIGFWFYLVPLVPSILCSIFVLYHLLAKRALRNAVNNHVVILMVSFGLLYEITDIVWYIHFYRTGTPILATETFCRVWVFIDGAVYVIIALLMAWASIERHILIFHSSWVATRVQRFFLHYLPLIIACMYPTVFYGVIFFVLPCDVWYGYNLATCNQYACISWTPSLSLWDSAANYIAPVFVIVVFSVALLARVVYRKCRVHGRVEWRNYRKMAVQLLSISAIYFVFLLPPTILSTAYTAGLPWDDSEYYYTALYFGYYTVLLTPFVCVMPLPELRSKFKRLFFCRRERAVGPASTVSNERNGDRVTVS